MPKLAHYRNLVTSGILDSVMVAGLLFVNDMIHIYDIIWYVMQLTFSNMFFLQIHNLGTFQTLNTHMLHNTKNPRGGASGLPKLILRISGYNIDLN